MEARGVMRKRVIWIGRGRRARQKAGFTQAIVRGFSPGISGAGRAARSPAHELRARI